ncbi:YciI family protein [Corynebacterium aquatimens]|uniref:Uncharacterized protein YciI n=1 Tax=Corynebacterium aquatimens TaxID=1190508 RepID=A0A931DZB8_9CORY|nr:YciI family protein [Corynebacterium aquatimens]MBG6121819.1 uncharacterized protein YciI [Corynebacterium aquatimens]WJY65643.1 YciI-like protein [Corynebacterium aquatimens]
MNYFVVTYTYSADLDLVMATRPAHREFISGLMDEGTVIAAGPFSDCDNQSMILFRLPDGSSAPDVDAALEGDPYRHAEALESWSIRPWNAVLNTFERD